MAKICLIMGGTGGLGKAAAELVATKGYTVVVSGRNKTKGEEVVDFIKSKGGEAVFLACDITSESDIRQLHKSIVDKYGRIDAAVNSAGVVVGSSALVNMKLEDFNSTIQINLTAVFISMQEQMRAMLKQDPPGGHIINLTSIFGLHACPWGANYSASKHAIVGLTRSAALEVANQNIYINAIAPGLIPTGMVNDIGETAKIDAAFGKIIEAVPGQYPVERFGTPDQTAKAVAYLLDCDWVTGTVLEVDGGWGAGKSIPVGVKCTG
ncbi:hypothetical protein M409DRAFT_61602 [Zasmidium cellare ATCC 36951]|uniref:Uncharacterized protein n=1 Tax=Zasmidium cellare ATCC 36951 TaxID=1080233 RepID=A0A6A6BY94_ZASCE|nr:uncharacterized protein M409DRAFT_61602 [Zasmidium cellare ATCC 36951]KAF2158499.1 hypothetical protein M409DRAFT_61602 [Zasmidium cellare ATCC 36951]